MDFYLKENYGTITTSVAQWKANRFYYLEPRFKTNCKENELLRPDSTGCETVSFNKFVFLICYRTVTDFL